MKYFTLFLLLSFFICACSVSKNTQSSSAEFPETPDYTTDPTLPSKGKKSAVKTVLPASEPMIHVVQMGESLWIIAKKYDISVQDIIEANKIEDANLIKVNQELVIPRNKK